MQGQGYIVGTTTIWSILLVQGRNDIYMLGNVGSWIQQLDNSGIEIKNAHYTVSFELLPCDQMFLTIMAGELFNSATSPRILLLLIRITCIWKTFPALFRHSPVLNVCIMLHKLFAQALISLYYTTSKAGYSLHIFYVLLVLGAIYTWNTRIVSMNWTCHQRKFWRKIIQKHFKPTHLNFFSIWVF